MSEVPFHVRAPTAPAVPLLVSIPHTGVEVPDAIHARFASPAVAALPDTDWHQHELYDFVPALGATTVYARYSRYVIDLNRPKSQAKLYPGKTETRLVPIRTFADAPIYRDGDEPTPAEIEARIATYWQPYHDKLASELARLRETFGYALLFDAHSIMSFVPRLHPTPLPDLMLGDVDGTSCAGALSDAVLATLTASTFTSHRNFRFKGGFITRSFGDPERGVHALQLEMSQRIYMDETPPSPSVTAKAAHLRPVLRAALLAFVAAARRAHA